MGCLCGQTEAGSVRSFNVTLKFGPEPVETHPRVYVCMCVRQSQFAHLTAIHWSLWFLPQETCTWIRDRTSL